MFLWSWKTNNSFFSIAFVSLFMDDRLTDFNRSCDHHILVIITADREDVELNYVCGHVHVHTLSCRLGCAKIYFFYNVDCVVISCCFVFLFLTPTLCLSESCEANTQQQKKRQAKLIEWMSFLKILIIYVFNSSLALVSAYTTAERRKTPKKLLCISFSFMSFDTGRDVSDSFRSFWVECRTHRIQNPKREERRLHRVEESYYCIKYGRARASLNEGQQVAQSRVLTACRAVVVACREDKL